MRKFDPERVKKKLSVSDEEFEENWDGIFKRNSKNIEKNRYKREDRRKNPDKPNGKIRD